MQKVVITGSEGTVGQVLTGRSLVETDRPELQADITRVDIDADKGGTPHPFIQSDLQDRELIKHLLATHDIFIHGAWNTEEGMLRPDVLDPKNLEMAQRILECAEELGERAAKLVMFSSVNAHVPEDWKTRRESGDFIDVSENPTPNQHNKKSTPGNGTTHYGESKASIEELAQQTAQKETHIVVPRLGGVNLHNKKSSEYEVHQTIYNDPDRGAHFDAAPGGWEDASRLTHEDLIDDIQNAIDTPKQPGTFELYNLVSDSQDRVHKTKKE